MLKIISFALVGLAFFAQAGLSDGDMPDLSGKSMCSSHADYPATASQAKSALDAFDKFKAANPADERIGDSSTHSASGLEYVATMLRGNLNGASSMIGDPDMCSQALKKVRDLAAELNKGLAN